MDGRSALSERRPAEEESERPPKGRGAHTVRVYYRKRDRSAPPAAGRPGSGTGVHSRESSVHTSLDYFNVSMSVNQSGVPTYTNTLDLRAQFGFALSVQTLPGGANATLVGNVTTLNLTAAVIDSAIGPMPGISIKALAKTLGPIVQKLINALLGKGIPISPKGGLLSNGTVFTEDGFITLAADFAKLL